MLKKNFSFSFIFVVVVPVILAGVYYFFIASEQYLVEAKYVIQGREQAQGNVSGLSAFSGLDGTSTSTKYVYIAQEYMWSAELLNKLDSELKVKEHYSNIRYDWWARLSKNASYSAYLEYWYNLVEIKYDSTSEITTLGITAFSADVALTIANQLLEETEKHVNKLSERARTDSLDFAKKELKDAEERLVQARSNITGFRSSKKEIDPQRTTAIRLALTSELESKLVEAKAEFNTLSTFMQPDTFKIRLLKNKIEGLKKQIQTEKNKWGNVEDNTNTLSARIASYEKLLARKMIAERFYETALSSLEIARLKAIQQQQYLEVIVSPYKPDEAEKPYVLDKMITVMLGSFLFWVIGSLVVSAIKDHT